MSRLPLLALVTTAFALPAMPANAQNRGTMVVDDGETRRVLHYTEPDLTDLLRSDLVRSDRILLQQDLTLSEVQMEAVLHVIDTHNESWATLLAAFDDIRREGVADADGFVARGIEPLPPNPPQPPARGDGPGGPPLGDDPQAAIEGIMLDELQKAGFDITSMDDLPVEPRVSVGVDVEDNGSGPVPNVDVGLTFEGDGDALTDEMRDKLQTAADSIVPRITEVMEERLAKRFAGGGGGPMANPDSEIDAKWNDMQERRRRIEELREAKAALREDSVAAIHTLLSEPQLERWPVADRTLVRVKTLPRAELDGEGTDLIALTADLELNDTGRAMIAEDLERYAQQLGDALARRNKLLDTADALVDEALYDGDAAGAKSIVDRVTRSRVAIRTLNDQYAEIIASHLDETSGPVFSSAVREANHPTIFRTTIAQRAFRAASELDALDGDARNTITEIAGAYDEQLKTINERLRRIVRRHQAELPNREIERLVSVLESPNPRRLADPTPQTELNEAFQARRDLDVQYMRNLYAVVAPEYHAELPPIPTAGVADPIRSSETSGGF